MELKRENNSLMRQIQQYCSRIQQIQECLQDSDKTSMQNGMMLIESMKIKIIELEKKYEKNKPILHLVENMVKLGSLYSNMNQQPNNSDWLREYIEKTNLPQFDQMKSADIADWNKFNANNLDLKVMYIRFKIQQNISLKKS